MGNSYLTVCSVISNKWAYISEVWGSLNPHNSQLNPLVLKSAFDRKKNALGTEERSSSDTWFTGAEFEEQLINEDSELKESDWRDGICAKLISLNANDPWSLFGAEEVTSIFSRLLWGAQFSMHPLPR